MSLLLCYSVLNRAISTACIALADGSIQDDTFKVERAKQNPNELSGVLCKEFNIRGTVKTAWLSFQEIDNTESFSVEEFKGTYCIGGVDVFERYKGDVTLYCRLRG